eukprot:gene7311-biopygen10
MRRPGRNESGRGPNAGRTWVARTTPKERTRAGRGPYAGSVVPPSGTGQHFHGNGRVPDAGSVDFSSDVLGAAWVHDGRVAWKLLATSEEAGHEMGLQAGKRRQSERQGASRQVRSESNDKVVDKEDLLSSSCSFAPLAPPLVAT